MCDHDLCQPAEGIPRGVSGRTGEPATRRYVIVLGNCSEVSPEDSPEITVIRVANEQDLLEEWCCLVVTCDPDILRRYNIYMFDYGYMNARYLRRHTHWPALGRVLGEPATMEKISWESNTYGFQDTNFLTMPGRLSVDMLTVVKKDHKLEVYKLEVVDQYFLGKSKHNVSPQEIFKAYEDMVHTTRAVEAALTEGPAVSEASGTLTLPLATSGSLSPGLRQSSQGGTLLHPRR